MFEYSFHPIIYIYIYIKVRYPFSFSLREKKKTQKESFFYGGAYYNGYILLKKAGECNRRNVEWTKNKTTKNKNKNEKRSVMPTEFW